MEKRPLDVQIQLVTEALEMTTQLMAIIISLTVVLLITAGVLSGANNTSAK